MSLRVPWPEGPTAGRRSAAALLAGWSRCKRARRRLLAPLYRVADTGLFGLTPLQTHILICGFPASGTTLLQLMVENGLPRARRFGREVGGWRAATYAWRNHAVVVSKVPHDVFRLDPLRAFYASRRAELRVLLMLRDPRDLLTARRPRTGRGAAGCGRHTGDDGDSTVAGACDGGGYCVTPDQWRRYWVAFDQHRRDADAHVVRYEDLVVDVGREQRRIEAFVGRPMAVPFADFLTVDRPDFDATALGGRRPLEATRVARWRAPAHAARLSAVLSALPELPTALVGLGYEPDASWAEPYHGPAAPASV